MDELLIAVHAEDWYAVAAIVIGALVFFWKRFAPALWGKIPKRWRFAVPLALAAATGFLGAFYAEKELSAALMQALVAAFYAGLPAAGGHHVLKDLPISYGEK